jgi:ribosomal protein L37AE/L43A
MMPCKRLRQLDARYRSKYGMSMIDNLNEIKKRGMDKFLEQQVEKYTCPTCHGLLNVHRSHCFSCGSSKTE